MPLTRQGMLDETIGFGLSAWDINLFISYFQRFSNVFRYFVLENGTGIAIQTSSINSMNLFWILMVFTSIQLVSVCSLRFVKLIFLIPKCVDPTKN